MRRSQGFTLIELIAVIVMISAGLLPLVKLFSNVTLNLSQAEDIQRTAQYAQNCAEKIIGIRRDLLHGYSDDSIKSGTELTKVCDSLPSGFVYGGTTTIGNNFTGTTDTACPGTKINCKYVTVTVSNESSASSSIKLMLVSY